MESFLSHWTDLLKLQYFIKRPGVPHILYIQWDFVNTKESYQRSTSKPDQA